jgi:hypothetical protein
VGYTFSPVQQTVTGARFFMAAPSFVWFVWFIWLVWSISFIWLIWFVWCLWLISFNPKNSELRTYNSELGEAGASRFTRKSD